MTKSDLQEARARVLLQDAMLADLSFATRMACAFEAVYFYVVGGNEGPMPKATSPLPDEQSLLSGLERNDCSPDDTQLGTRLLQWYVNQWELPPPPCSLEMAIAWARRIIKSD